MEPYGLLLVIFELTELTTGKSIEKHPILSDDKGILGRRKFYIFHPVRQCI